MARPRGILSPLDRFILLADFGGDENDCVQWLGAKAGGYGQFRGNERKVVKAHRWSYEEFVGPIPEGHELDHICHTRAVASGTCLVSSECLHRSCVNPYHLDPVSHLENSLRGLKSLENIFCGSGRHLMSETSRRVGLSKIRSCHPCRMEYQRKRRANQ